MKNLPNIATRVFVIPAGASSTIVREAEFITCLESSAPFKMRLDQGPFFDFEAGLGLTVAEKFGRADFLNDSDTDITVRVALGRGDVQDARLVLSGTVATRVTEPVAIKDPVAISGTVDTRVTAPVAISGTVATREAVPSKFWSYAPRVVATGSSRELMAANGARREVLVSLAADAAGPVFLSDREYSFAIGVPLQPGSTATLQTTSAVWAYNNSGQNASVYISEMVA